MARPPPRLRPRNIALRGITAGSTIAGELPHNVRIELWHHGSHAQRKVVQVHDDGPRSPCPPVRLQEPCLRPWERASHPQGDRSHVHHELLQVQIQGRQLRRWPGQVLTAVLQVHHRPLHAQRPLRRSLRHTPHAHGVWPQVPDAPVHAQVDKLRPHTLLLRAQP